MKNASINTIKEMYKHYFDSNIQSRFLNQLKDDMISPAEIVNVYRFIINNTIEDEIFKNSYSIKE